MPNSNDRLADSVIAHAIYLLKFGNGRRAAILKLLRGLEKDLLQTIAGRLATIEERGIDIGPATTARIESMLEETRALIDRVYTRAQDDLVTELDKLAPLEADFQARAINRAIPTEATVTALLPSPSKLATIATTRPFEGRLMSKWFGDMAEGTKGRIEASVKLGMAEGWSIEKIVRRVRREDMEVSRKSARTVVRTAVNHVATQAAQETYRANERLIAGWQFLATLDSRTTIICASLDQQIFEIGKGPLPPRHRGCRSTTTPVLKSAKQAGLNLSSVGRASMDGQVASPKTFDSWLRDQSEERKLSVLGRTRLNLWQNGKLKLTDFVRDDTDILSLEELRRLHPDAFD